MKQFFLIATLLAFFACNNSKENMSAEATDTTVSDTSSLASNDTADTELIVYSKAKTEPSLETVFFKAYGPEPHWSLAMTVDIIDFKSQKDSIVAATPEVIRAADGNVKTYKVKTETKELDIEIIHKPCKDGSTGEMKPYTVRIKIKKVGTSDVVKLEGCGQYIIDYRLHDIWVLDQMGGEPTSDKEFSGNIPFLEINGASSSFTGFGGCNDISGNLFFEKDILRFTDVISTKKACISNNREADFLKYLAASVQFNIGENSLSLSNQSGPTLVFKKID